MSLVDYASSEEEEEEEEEAIDLQEKGEEKGKQQMESAAPSLSPPSTRPLPPSIPLPDRQNQCSLEIGEFHATRTKENVQKIPIAANQPSNVVPPLPLPSLEGLLDVSVLFATQSYQSSQTVGTDHSSRVAAALAETASRKRESDGSTFPQPSSKHSRGQLRRLRNVPNTKGGLLVPPQLSGRSNVVTEDIGKFFVSKLTESSR
ncbi:uncharacterized protein LOC135649148 isoform X1 [Musa acuminata AAA Group]|uniref:uncharacterized protein LOC135649148 isoform X1 n=1 Tax=Musa acuminata AAA Group TaxID=214697 RepID=UPI0031D486A6